MQPCAKCTDPARALMDFSYVDRIAWLRDLDATFDRFTDYPLCVRHADRFVTPIGWQLDDRRGRRFEQPLLVADVA